MFGELTGNTRSAKGHRGEVRAGYQLAATVGSWTLTPGTKVGTHVVAGEVAVMSEHWLGHRPLTLALGVGHGEWIWDDVQPVVSGDRITVVVNGRPRLERS